MFKNGDTETSALWYFDEIEGQIKHNIANPNKKLLLGQMGINKYSIIHIV